MKEDKIRVILVESGKKAKIAEIENTFEEKQRIVNGYIEVVYPFDEEVCIVCNEEGKFDGSLPNRALLDKNIKVADIIFGTFIICGVEGECFASLTEEQIHKYQEMFYYPEIFSIDKSGNVFSQKIID